MHALAQIVRHKSGMPFGLFRCSTALTLGACNGTDRAWPGADIHHVWYLQPGYFKVCAFANWLWQYTCSTREVIKARALGIPEVALAERFAIWINRQRPLNSPLILSYITALSPPSTAY